MATYGLYKQIEPSSITSSLDSLEKEINATKSDLSALKNGLTDTVWKASAKDNLFKAFTTIDTEVYKEITTAITNLRSIAKYVSNYKAAESSALTYKGYINSATEKTSASTIAGWRSSLSAYEKTMTECENSINQLK